MTQAPVKEQSVMPLISWSMIWVVYYLSYDLGSIFLYDLGNVTFL